MKPNEYINIKENSFVNLENSSTPIHNNSRSTYNKDELNSSFVTNIGESDIVKNLMEFVSRNIPSLYILSILYL